MSAAKGSAIEQAAVLKGWPSVREFVRLVKTRSAPLAPVDDTLLVKEWQQANERAQKLEPLRSSKISSTELAPLPYDTAEEAKARLQSLGSSNPFALLPHEWAMVELNELITWQRYVNLSFANDVQSTLPRYPSERFLLDFCFGLAREEAPVHVSGTPGGNHYAFSSATTDFRVLDTVPLDTSVVSGLNVRGRVAAVVAVLVGYTYNAMWAIQMEDRLVLLNGTHRAYALRAHGVTHAPCIVSRVTSRNDLELVDPAAAGNSSLEWHFTYPRPPQLRDFFDETLVRVMPTLASSNLLHLELKFTRSRIPLSP